MSTLSAVISELSAQNGRPWEPLLAGSLKDRALESAAAIAADLAFSQELAAHIERLFPHSMAHGVREGTERIFDRILSRLVRVAKTKGRGRAWPVSDAIQTDYEAHLAMSSRERFLMSEDWLQKGMTGYYKLSAAHGSIGTAGAL